MKSNTQLWQEQLQQPPTIEQIDQTIGRQGFPVSPVTPYGEITFNFVTGAQLVAADRMRKEKY